MFHLKKGLKSPAVWMALFSVVILITGCHGGEGGFGWGPEGPQAKVKVYPPKDPPEPVPGPDGWYYWCPEGPDGPCWRITPPHGPIQPIGSPEFLLPPGPEPEQIDIGEIPGIQILPVDELTDAGGQQMVSIAVSHVQGSTDPGVMEILTEEGPAGPQGQQTVTLNTDLNVVFHNPRNSPYIQTTPDGGLIIDFDSAGLEGETLDTLLNEPVTVSMLLPAAYNPFPDNVSQEEPGGAVSVSLDGSLLNCLQTLMDHGVEEVSLGRHGSLVRSGSFIVGTLYLEDDEENLVPYDVTIPL